MSPGVAGQTSCLLRNSGKKGWNCPTARATGTAAPFNRCAARPFRARQSSLAGSSGTWSKNAAAIARHNSAPATDTYIPDSGLRILLSKLYVLEENLED